MGKKQKLVQEAKLLKSFMEEFFPFEELQKVGFFTKEMKGDYDSQSKRVCEYFGYKTVYEHGAEEVKAHLSYSKDRIKDEPFVTVIPSIYE